MSNNRNFIHNFNDVPFEEDYNEYESLGDFRENYTTKEEKNNLFFNTKDINYIYGDETYNFSINFSSGNNDESSINRTFKNVTRISFINLVIKDAYVDLNHANYLYNKKLLTLEKCIRLERISDLPYLILEITDINNINYGTNNAINKSSFFLKCDDDKEIRNNSGTFVTYAENDHLEYNNLNNSLLPETNNKILYYSCFNNTPMNFYPTPKGILKNMKISIKTPQGKILKKMNNYLTITNISLNNGIDDNNNPSYILAISTSEMFSPEEYSLGDRIIFKNVSVSDTLSRKNDLETYLNDSNGLLIISHISILGETKMVKSFGISLKNELVKDANNTLLNQTIIEDDFGLSTSSPTFCTGTIINSSQQVLLGLEITNEIRDNNLLNSNLI